MLTVEGYGKIRIAHRDGMSIRQIARRHVGRLVRDRRETFIPLTHPLRPTSGGGLRPHLRGLSRRAAAGLGAAADVESLGVSLCRRVAQRADGGDPGGDGRGV
jgi:hypothetical protein